MEKQKKRIPIADSSGFFFLCQSLESHVVDDSAWESKHLAQKEIDK